MERLYDLFRSAPDLGSLLDPRTVTEDLFALGFDTLKGTVERALKKIAARDDPDRVAIGVAAHGIALAASLMSREFTLVATNVPYLARGKQAKSLRDYLGEVYPAGQADLATAFVERCRSYCGTGGSVSLVSPQNWWFLGSYAGFRRILLNQSSWRLIAALSEEAWHSFGLRGPKATFLVLSNSQPPTNNQLIGIDASLPTTPEGKAEVLKSGVLIALTQTKQRENPDARITLDEASHSELLSKHADCLAGILNGDSERLRRYFWEIIDRTNRWHPQQSTFCGTSEFDGRQMVIDFDTERFQIRAEDHYRRERLHYSDKRGQLAWRRWGVAVSQMRSLDVTLFSGDLFDSNVAVILPKNPSFLPAIWCYCRSEQFQTDVRRIDQKVNVTNATLVKVPFDLVHWKNIAATEYPDGLPEPHSKDATQWLFKGHPKGSIDPLQVAVARLLGYRWPDQEPDNLDGLTDSHGIVPIPSVRGESPAAERLRELLKAAFGSEWSGSLEHKLLNEAGASPGTTLDDWLRNSFFEQHCKRFHQRPFIWHLWDGRKDGFSCLVNYHKLTHNVLDNLTHSYVQDWINLQAADARNGKPGADLRLAAAQALQEKLKLILAGEPDYDIFVRWKPLSEQPIGWNPDLNDGVRMNIRPFVEAGVLRKPPNIKWTKDRGNEPQRPKEEYPWFWPGGTFKGDRVNDVHLTNQEKMDAMRYRS